MLLLITILSLLYSQTIIEKSDGFCNNKEPVYKNQKITNLEAEIFYYALSKYEPFPASIVNKVLNI